jgi:hypothetical protein
MIVCIDFDKTLINKNSFPLWIKFALKRSFFEKRFNILARLSILILFRKILPILNHTNFKRAINRLTYPDNWASEFCLSLYKNYKIEFIAKKINQYESQNYVITTAAPFCYAKAIPEYFNFNTLRPVLICSKEDGAVFVDNYQKNKMINTLRLIGNQNFILFTDHSDDIPLALKAAEVYLCNPKKECIDSFAKNNIDYKILEA